jgi:DNA recombination protein RmuC
MISELIPVVLVLLMVVSIVLLVSQAHFFKRARAFVSEVRDDLRIQREEARGCARELREELSSTLRSQEGVLQSTLSDHKHFKQLHFEAMARQIRELTDSGVQATNSLRTMLEGRLSAVQELNERKLDAIRQEIGQSMKASREVIAEKVEQMSSAQLSELSAMNVKVKELAESNQLNLERIRGVLDLRIREIQEGNDRKLTEIRETLDLALTRGSEELLKRLEKMSTDQQAQLGGMNQTVGMLTQGNAEVLERVRATLDFRVEELQASHEKRWGELRQEVSTNLKSGNEANATLMQGLASAQNTKLESMTGQLKELSEGNRVALEAMREGLDERVKALQESNEKKLEEMRRTVDEKLHETLERRLGETFKQVSDRLESVHKGLGEMQSLASGVGDLKRVLTNVKTRGTWAEVQLGAILDQMLTPDQYAKNVCIKEGSTERVEFAVRLPGPKDDPKACVWLPIDSKFPKEDYARLQAAAEAGEPHAVQAATEALLRALRLGARTIHDKYLYSPATTDFAIMFLATEGLYAEALRQPQFAQELLEQYRVLIAGPSTFAALLSSLRMGFQTLVVEQRAAEVWRILGAVKTEFGKFGVILAKVEKQLGTASKTIKLTGRRTRAMERRLRTVDQLPSSESAMILALPAAAAMESGDDHLKPAPRAQSPLSDSNAQGSL